MILHLVAHSRERTLAGALRDALLQLEGAFSLVFLAEDRVIVARDPHGFRPLAMGQLEFSGGTIALRFRIGNLRVRSDQAVYLEVQPGEMVIVGPEGVTRERFAPERPLLAVRFRTCLFFASGFDCLRPPGAGIARDSGHAAGARSAGGCRYRGAGARFRGAAALGYSAESGCLTARR